MKIKPTRYEDGRPMLLAGLRAYHAYFDAQKSLSEQWASFDSLQAIPRACGQVTYGVICGHDANGFEYMCGIEVENFDKLPDDIGRMRIEAQYYAVFLHVDSIATLSLTWDKIMKEWFPSAGVESAHKPDFELYSPDFNKNTGESVVEIWVSIARG